MGESLTSSGQNAFYTGWHSGSHNLAGSYRHSLSSALASFGTPVTCSSSLTVSGQLTAASLSGGASTQITNEINTAVSTKQDTLSAHGGSGNNVLNSAIPAGKLANIFGSSPINVSAIYAPGTADHGNLQVSIDSNSLNPFWVAGKVQGSNVTKLADKGRVGFTVQRSPTHNAGVFNITFNQAHPDGDGYVISVTSEMQHDKVWENNTYAPDANGFSVVIYNQTNALVNADFYFSVLV